jgi:hypothetical protein
MDLFCYGFKKEKPVLQFSPCRKTQDIQWEDWNYAEYLFIPRTDVLKLLKDKIEKIFPINDPENNEIVECFEVSSITWIGKNDWERLIKIIEKDNPANEKEVKFYYEFKNWINEQLKSVEIIVIDGW